MRVPKLFELRADPFSAATSSILYDKWMADRAFVQVPAQAFVANWLESFKEFPVRPLDLFSSSARNGRVFGIGGFGSPQPIKSLKFNQ